MSAARGNAREPARPTRSRQSTRSSTRSNGSERSADSNGRAAQNGRPGARNLTTVVRAAREQFAELTGSIPESVTGVRSLQDGEGWSVLVDVVELERIPSSTSVLATYRVDIDDEGSISSYERVRRYTRGATDSS